MTGKDMLRVGIRPLRQEVNVREGVREPMKIYTKTGDAGETGLFGGPRVRKDDTRIEAFGTVDELNSQIGAVRTFCGGDQGSGGHQGLGGDLDALLRHVQCDLFELGAQLATPKPDAERITPRHVEAIEQAIDRYDATLPPLDCFILPAGSPAAVAMHVARTVCRRAERRVVALAGRPGASIPSNAIEYLNRVGDLLFVLARHANAVAGLRDDPWHATTP